MWVASLSLVKMLILWCVLLASTLYSIKLVNAASVSLTVEGGVSLIGPHCPGAIRLLCEGVELTTLMWKYNENMTIGDIFPPDGIVKSKGAPLNSAFVSVELVNVYTSDQVFANFSSILTTNLSQLEQQNITSISCGDALTSDTVPVDVQIEQEGVPGDPEIIGVNINRYIEAPNLYRVTIELKKMVVS